MRTYVAVLAISMLGCGESALWVDEGGQGTGCTDNGGTASVGSELTSSRPSSVLALPQPGTLSSPVDAYGAYDRAIDSTKVCGGTVLREGVQQAADYFAPFGIIGKSYRGCQTGFHPIGQALDVYLDGSRVSGLQPFADWLTANDGEMARRLGVVQIFFNSHMWRSYDSGPGRRQGKWTPFTAADPHTGHIHLSFGEAGATGTTSFFSQVINFRAPPIDAQPVSSVFPRFTQTATGLRLASVGAERLLDTRATGALEAGQVMTALTAAQVGGATAVALGVALIAPDADTFLTLAGGGAIAPTSTVNAKAGTVRANQTLVSLSSGLASMQSAQRTHVIVDEQARFGAAGAGFTALGPSRLLDTRGSTAFSAGEVRVVSLGALGVPSSAVAAQLGLVAVPRGLDGFVSVIPCGENVKTSALNFDGAQVASSGALAAVRGGNICLFSSVAVDLVVDVAGYYDVGGASLSLVEPARVLDTRSGIGGWLGMPSAGQVLRLELSSMPGWQGSSAVAFNLTVVGSSTSNFARVWDCSGNPEHSNVNGAPDSAVATFGVVRSGGSLCVSSSAPQHVIVDLVGVYR